MSISFLTYPEGIVCPYVIQYQGYEDELYKLIKGSGIEQAFTGIYTNRLLLLNKYNREAMSIQPVNFEKMKHDSDGLFSLHAKVRGEKNIRVIFCFISIKDDIYAVLLSAFDEKEKDKSKKSYKYAKIVAKKRYKELCKNDKD